jgi:hypothetical protein
MRYFLLIGALLASPAQANSQQAAETLGSIIAAEHFCGLRYDEDVLNNWVDDRVHYSDSGFYTVLHQVVDYHEQQQNQMPSATRSSHCRTILEMANYYGFLEDDRRHAPSVAYATARERRPAQ